MTLPARLCRLFFLVLVLASALVHAQNCGRSRRRPWRSLSCSEQAAFLRACQALKESGRWDELVLNHQRSGDWGHLVPAFLLWHRWILWVGERELQRISGTCLTIPYWDWERAGGPESIVNADGFGSRIRGCVRDGVANNWVAVETGGCVTRTFDDRVNIQRDVEIINRITNTRDFGRFRRQLEAGPHTGPHLWVGGQMTARWAVDDPLFFVHHANVDRIYTLWQNYWGHPQTPPQSLGAEHYDANLNSGLVLNYVRQIDWFSPRTGRSPTIRELMYSAGANAIVDVTYESDQLAQMLVQSSSRFAQDIDTSWNNPGRVSSTSACQGPILGTGGGGGGGGGTGGGGNPDQGGGGGNGGGGTPQPQCQAVNQGCNRNRHCCSRVCSGWGGRCLDSGAGGGGNPPAQQVQGQCQEVNQGCNRNRHCCSRQCSGWGGRCLSRRNIRALQHDDMQIDPVFEEPTVSELEGEDVDEEEENDYLSQIPDFGDQQNRWYELMEMYSTEYPDLIFATLAKEDCEARESVAGHPLLSATPEWLTIMNISTTDIDTYNCHSSKDPMGTEHNNDGGDGDHP